MQRKDLTKKAPKEMDDNLFAVAIVCEKFSEWINNPDTKAETEKRREILAKHYCLPKDCEVITIMTAFLAGADAGAEIMSKLYDIQ